MKKRFLYIVFATLIVASLLAACGQTSTPEPTEAPQQETVVEEVEEPVVEEAEEPVAEEAEEMEEPATEEAEEAEAEEAEEPVAEEAVPEQSDVILLVTPASQSVTTFTYNFNPFATTFLFPAQNGMYEPLMINNRIVGELVPWLATDYAWSEDNMTLTLTLREGVTWSDGEAFTADDVVFTFDLLKSVPGLAGYGLVAVQEGGYIDSVTADGDYTVNFNFNKVYTPGFYDLISQNIVPEHIWSEVEDPVTFTNIENVVGTGPFTEIVNMQDQVYQVDRNPNYWQPGKPYIQGMRMPAFSGNDTAATMFVNGDTEWTGQFFNNVDDAVLAQNPEDLHCWWPAVTSDQFFMMNGTIAPFDDPVVRKAISMSFNRELLIELALQGKSTSADVTGLSSGYAFWKVDDPTTLGNWTDFNVDEANTMLDEAGYVRGDDGVRTNPDGTRWSHELLMVNGFSDWLAVAPTLKSNLESIGFEITINNYDPGQTFEKWFVGDFEMSLYFGIDADTPYVYYRNIMSEETYLPIGEYTGFGQNIWRIAIPEADEQLKIFGSTGDPEVQIEAAQELQRIFAENAPVIPMWHAPTFYCYNDAQVGGWATEENQAVRAMPIATNSTGEQLIQMILWESK